MKIGIANDMVMAVEALRRTLADYPEYTVIWVAHDGQEAVKLASENTPDVLLMDLYMPVMDGVEAIRQIMAKSPCAILVVTATVEGHSGKVFEALGAGALDAVSTPAVGSGKTSEGQERLLEKLQTLSRLLGNRKKKVRPSPEPTRSATPPSRLPDSSKALVVIGASAGGPQAIAQLLKSLPGNFPPIVIAQHIDGQFAAGMAAWLAGQTSTPLRLAQSGDNPSPGQVYVAGSDEHLVLSRRGQLEYIADSGNSNFHPCIDVFFHSVARYWRGNVVAVLLSGMGRDGALGLKAIREMGGLTIAQDKETSVVYGMPKAAAAMGAAEKILPLPDIGAALIKYFREKGRGGTSGGA